ncbi:ATP-dependent Clp protease ATP-binding subunit, partial [Candidatus Microgenomates bacterium]|nr:ATP-dependent Clp protease ATP-binding subunit [Candidatus Microgenomates bacterium]
IIYGLALSAVAFLIGLVPAIIWGVIPVLTLPLYLARKPKGEEEVKNLLNRSKNEPEVLFHLLMKHPEGEFVMRRLGLDKNVILNSFQDLSILHSRISLRLKIPDQVRNDNKPTPCQVSEVWKYLAESYPPFAKIFSENNLKADDVYETALWFEKLQTYKTPPLIFDLEKIKSLPGIGADWAYGYTVEFDKYAKDITHRIPAFPLLVGREKELERLERILIKTEANNAIVVGEPGVARHMIVETLAHRIMTGSGNKNLSHKRILSLNMHSLISSSQSQGEVKGITAEIIEEAERAGNIIAVIDEMEKYVTNKDGGVDLSDIFAKFAESSIGIIGITTPSGYHRYIETNPILSPLFEKIEIDPPTLETVMEEMEISIVPVLERKHKMIISYQAVKKTIEDADRYISTTPFPAKAIELLDGACVYKKCHPEERSDEGSRPISRLQRDSSSASRRTQNDTLTASDIDEFLSEKLKVTVGEPKADEKEKLANLETLLHRRIINQEEAINVISSALRRSKLNISSAKKPIGSFLFLGPTGVGKTETAKALAQVYFGDESKMLRFDMSQYQKTEGLERLIGSSLLGTTGELTSALTDKPFSLVLFDEFEKSPREIYNLFLTLLDEGYISDAKGKKVDAKNSIIIATSNAGSEFIRENINAGKRGEELKNALLEYIQKEDFFSPELLNRFDAVVVFSTLSEGHLREVAKLQLGELNKRLAPKEISVAITSELVKQLALVGHNRQFGGREMRRVIAEKIEDEIANKLLSGKVKKGEVIEIASIMI